MPAAQSMVRTFAPACVVLPRTALNTRSALCAAVCCCVGDCDVNLMMRLEEWGFPHEFTMRSFKTFPFNHASASYAILEDKLIGQRE